MITDIIVYTFWGALGVAIAAAIWYLVAPK